MRLFLSIFFFGCVVISWGQKPELVVPVGHTDAITCVAYSHDEEYILTGSIDKQVKLWSIEGQLIRTYHGHAKGIIDTKFSPKRNYIVTKSDSLTRLWTIFGEIVQTFPTINTYPNDLDFKMITERYDPPLFSPDEQFFITSASDTTLTIYNISENTQKVIPCTNKQNVQFSPDGKFLLTQKRRTILLLDRNYEVAHQFQVQNNFSKALFTNNEQIVFGYLYQDFNKRPTGHIQFYTYKGDLVRQLGRPSKAPKTGDIFTFQTSYDTIYEPNSSNFRIDTTYQVQGFFVRTTASDPEYDTFWNEMFMTPDDQVLILNSERGTEIHDLQSQVLTLNSKRGTEVQDLQNGLKKYTQTLFPKMEPAYPVDLDTRNKFLLVRNWDYTSATITNLDLDKIITINNLYASPVRYGPRSATWPSPIVFSKKQDHLLIGYDNGQVAIKDFKGNLVRSFDTRTFNYIQQIENKSLKGELEITFAHSKNYLESHTYANKDTLLPTVFFDLNHGILKTPGKDFVRWKDTGELPQKPENLANSTKNFTSKEGKYHLMGEEEPMMHRAHGAAVFSPFSGFVFVNDDRQNELFNLQSGYSIADIHLTLDQKHLLLSHSYGPLEVWDFPGLLKAAQTIKNAPDYTNEPPPDSYLHFKPTFSSESSAPYFLRSINQVPARSVLLDAAQDNFLFLKLLDWEGGRPFILDISTHFERANIEGSILNTYKGHRLEVMGAQYLKEGAFIVSWSKEHIAKIWKTETGEEIGTLYFFNDQDWVLTTPNGLFDASPGALNQLYYVVGFEIIELEQLKERYYEPGLLQKLLGYSKERIRPVDRFDKIKLYPAIVDTAIRNDQLYFKLKARNGGIGKASIFINGKEVIEEINPLPNRTQNAKRDSVLQFDLKKQAKFLLRHPDSTNIISIRAYNEEGWLKSRAVNLKYKVPPPKSKGIVNTEEGVGWKGALDPKLYVLSIGTSDYTGDQLDLQYADQDATMMAKAFLSVGGALFKNQNTQKVDSLEVYCFSTANEEATGVENTNIQWQFATKTNIQKTFESIQEKAKAEDIIVVYLSGHGVAQGGQDQTHFYYLTHAIASEESLKDPETRKAYTISSEELTQWINDIPALKQVLIIDACNSGQVVENLTNRTKTLNSSQIRALDRMKDRTGMFVLSGSASDKVSYEASEYGQGLLTYALLQGMLGVATRKDEEGKDIIDVMKLFQHARDEVPKLAASINGIQTPMLGFPSQAASFDIGLLDALAKESIPIGNKKPVVIRNVFLNETLYRDDIGLADALEALFRQETGAGAEADFIFVDVNQYPGAYSIGGLYTIDGETISLKAKLFQGDKEIKTLNVRPTTKVSTLAKFIKRDLTRILMAMEDE